MRAATYLAQFVAVSLILVASVQAALAVVRRREAHRLNILAFVVVVTLPHVLYKQQNYLEWAFAMACWLAVPYLVFRLVRHFRDVPRYLVFASIAVIFAGVGEAVAKQAHQGTSLDSFWRLLADGLLGVGAWMLFAEGRRTSGVTAKRLSLAGAGSVAVFCDTALTIYFALTPGVGQREFRPTFWLNTGALVCYFLAFNTPRRLKGRWQREEFARYLSHTTERDAEERGRHAARDLTEATDRSISQALILVALRPSAGADRLVVRASTNAKWVGTSISVAAGAIARVTQTRVAERVRPADCESDIAGQLAALGTHALIAPIETEAHVWGVALVVQRYGSLFPEDDLALLAQFCGYAATALDHAALVADARDRERRRADVRLQAAEARMALMLDGIKDYAMFILDRDGLVVTWHVGSQHVFGYQAEEMTGESAAPLFNLLPEQFQARLDEARELGRAVWEGPCRRRKGDRFKGATVIRPLEGDTDIVGFVAVTKDVTEQRDLEDRLRQSQKMEAIGQLAGGIAHDFNNMLLAILGNADLLAADAGDDQEQLELIGQIQNSVERAEALTGRLLAFGRRQVLQPTVVSLSGLVSDLLPMLRRVIGEHIEVVADAAQATRPVLGDRSQLEQVIVNLAVNARDAMPHGGRLTIRTTSEWLDELRAGGEVPLGDYALLEVVDTGIGMDASTLDRIFEPFFTTKGFGYGTGLGLATVYGNVKQMGGLIRVESEPGAGTTFRIYLPETQQRAQPPQPSTRQAMPRGHETILLVEDDGAVRAFLVRTLERQGYRVLSAEHPAAALTMAETATEPIDLVITDVVLPGLVGPEFVRALAELRTGQPPLPVLYISGYADGSPVWQGEVPRASHFLQKPFSASDLLTRIRQVLTPTEGPGSHAV